MSETDCDVLMCTQCCVAPARFAAFEPRTLAVQNVCSERCARAAHNESGDDDRDRACLVANDLASALEAHVHTQASSATHVHVHRDAPVLEAFRQHGDVLLFAGQSLDECYDEAHGAYSLPRATVEALQAHLVERIGAGSDDDDSDDDDDDTSGKRASSTTVHRAKKAQRTHAAQAAASSSSVATAAAAASATSQQQQQVTPATLAFDDLPDELLTTIYTNLRPEDRAVWAQLNQRTRAIAGDTVALTALHARAGNLEDTIARLKRESDILEGRMILNATKQVPIDTVPVSAAKDEVMSSFRNVVALVRACAQMLLEARADMSQWAKLGQVQNVLSKVTKHFEKYRSFRAVVVADMALRANHRWMIDFDELEAQLTPLQHLIDALQKASHDGWSDYVQQVPNAFSSLPIYALHDAAQVNAAINARVMLLAKFVMLANVTVNGQSYGTRGLRQQRPRGSSIVIADNAVVSAPAHIDSALVPRALLTAVRSSYERMLLMLSFSLSDQQTRKPLYHLRVQAIKAGVLSLDNLYALLFDRVHDNSNARLARDNYALVVLDVLGLEQLPVIMRYALEFDDLPLMQALHTRHALAVKPYVQTFVAAAFARASAAPPLMPTHKSDNAPMFAAIDRALRLGEDTHLVAELQRTPQHGVVRHAVMHLWLTDRPRKWTTHMIDTFLASVFPRFDDFVDMALRYTLHPYKAWDSVRLGGLNQDVALKRIQDRMQVLAIDDEHGTAPAIIRAIIRLNMPSLLRVFNYNETDATILDLFTYALQQRARPNTFRMLLSVFLGRAYKRELIPLVLRTLPWETSGDRDYVFIVLQTLFVKLDMLRYENAQAILTHERFVSSPSLLVDFWMSVVIAHQTEANQWVDELEKEEFSNTISQANLESSISGEAYLLMIRACLFPQQQQHERGVVGQPLYILATLVITMALKSTHVRDMNAVFEYLLRGAPLSHEQAQFLMCHKRFDAGSFSDLVIALQAAMPERAPELYDLHVNEFEPLYNASTTIDQHSTLAGNSIAAEERARAMRE